ncbi:MAG: protein phosphatase 2C domain-containing protein [Ferruginibacter sp.]
MADYFFGITDKGKRRQKNEDTFIAREMLNKRYVVACVIDGVGGYKGGDVAAAIARSAILEYVRDMQNDITLTLREAVIAANARINEEKKEAGSNEQMACVLTCAVVDVKANTCWYVHIGDTRLYLFRDNSLIKISRDHSAVGFLEESGKISEEEAMRHPKRNEIDKALGFETDIAVIDDDFIETGSSPFLPGDMLLLCSDGLTDMISTASISDILSSNTAIAEKAKQLIDAANDAGGNDNVTAVLVENKKQRKEKTVPVPVERKKEKRATADTKNNSSASEGKNTKKKNHSLLLLILFFVATASALLMITSWQNKNTAGKETIPAARPVLFKSKELAELEDSITGTGKQLTFPKKAAAIILTKPIIITKDSFLLHGNGIHIIADSTYKGPAFIIQSTAKNIVLDSLVLQGFDVGIAIEKNNTSLKNLRFNSCRIPVQYSMLLPDTTLTGRFKDSVFINNSTRK